jgi:hypothetical protein
MLINVPPIDRAPMWHKTINEKTIHSRLKGQFAQFFFFFTTATFSFSPSSQLLTS